MKTILFGYGDYIVGRVKHPKLSIQMIEFCKAKRKMKLDENVTLKDIGKPLFVVAFKDKATFERFIKHLNLILEAWDD